MGSMKERGAWSLLGLLGLLFIIMGFQGSLGKILACILVPSAVTINEGV